MIIAQKKTLEKKKGGFSLVEVMLSTSVFALLVTVLVGAYLYGQESTSMAGNRMRAILLAEEGLEAVKNIKDEDWANLNDGSYGIEVAGDQWELTSNEDETDIFTREITISSAGNNRKNISSNVTWQQNPQRVGSVEISTMLSFWNEIIQTAIEMGDWSDPSEKAYLNISGSQNGLKIKANEENAFIVRQNGSADFQAIDISESQNPTSLDSLNFNGHTTNIVISDSYAFLTSTNNSYELIIVNISNPQSLEVVSNYDLPGNQNTRGLFLVENLLYVVRDDNSQNDELYIFDVTQADSPSLIGSTDLNNDGNEVVVIGNHAYCATDGNEVEVVDVSNPSNPQSIGELNLSGSSNALTIDGEGSTIYVGRSSGQIHAVDISNPSNMIDLGVIDNGSVIRDIDLAKGTKTIFAASDENSAELQVINMENPSSPEMIGVFNTTGDINGVDYIEEKDIAVLASENNDKELIIIQPLNEIN